MSENNPPDCLLAKPAGYGECQVAGCGTEIVYPQGLQVDPERIVCDAARQYLQIKPR